MNALVKSLVAAALAFFLVTAGVTVAQDLVHHVPEPQALLPGAPEPEVAVQRASVTADTGSLSMSTVADGRSNAAKLIEVGGSGAATTVGANRALHVLARSNGASGHSIWFSLLGSDITIREGSLPSATVTVRMDGIAWTGEMHSDGGSASVQIVLQVQDREGTVLGTAPVLDDELRLTGMRALKGSNVSASVDVDVSAPNVVTAILYAKADVQGGNGGTFVDLDPAGSAEFGVSYQSVSVAVGGAPPPTTLAVVGAGYTLAQVAQHKVQADCWLAIGKRVYDASPYLRKHPGGYWMIVPVCGTDATKAFETQGERGSRHSYEAIDKLKRLDIGAFLG